MTKTRSMNLQDAGLLAMETDRVFINLGGATVFRLPDRAGPDFVRAIYRQWCSHPVKRAPFNYRLARNPWGSLLPRWEVLAEVDLQQHIFHISLPSPGTDHRLIELMGQLHSKSMDRARPMWEVYLIEGLSERRFAVYTKFHHALFDGVSAMRVLGAQFSSDPNEINRIPPWSTFTNEGVKPDTGGGTRGFSLSTLLDNASSGLKTARKTATAIADLAPLALGLADVEWPAVKAPETIFQLPLTARCKFGFVSFPFAHVKQLSKSAGCTINDIVLTVCGGALRQYLSDLNELPEKSVIACVPVSLNKEGNTEGGNTVSAISVELGTNVENMEDRFNAVRQSVVRGKELMSKMPDLVRDIYSGGLAGMIALEGIRGKRILRNPLYNLIITNVPGNREPRYLNGAKMLLTIPIPILLPGVGLNITVTSIGDLLYLSFNTCSDIAPDVERLGPLLTENFEELETVIRRAAQGGKGRERREGRSTPAQRRFRQSAAKVSGHATTKSGQQKAASRKARSTTRTKYTRKTKATTKSSQ